jgi:hypothetical protein
MRRLAAVNSVRSTEVRPGTRPRSMRSWRRKKFDRLVTDVEVADPLARGEQIQYASTELGWIAASSQGCLLYRTTA